MATSRKSLANNNNHKSVNNENPDPTLLTTAQLHREMDWIKNYVDDKFESIQREMKLGAEANTAAISKSELSYEKRFESVNEFRNQMADQAGRFMTSVESRALHSAALARIDDLARRFERSEGKDVGHVDQRSETRGNIIGAVGILSALIMLFIFLNGLNSKVDQNTQQRIKQADEIIKTLPHASN